MNDTQKEVLNANREARCLAIALGVHPNQLAERVVKIHKVLEAKADPKDLDWARKQLGRIRVALEKLGYEAPTSSKPTAVPRPEDGPASATS
jgi:hypothetical protein